MSHNIYIANTERALSTFEELCKGNDPRVLEWFKNTLLKYWQKQWSTVGASKRHPHLATPRDVTHDEKGRRKAAAAKDQSSFDNAARTIRPPMLSPLLINEEGGITAKEFTEQLMKAMTNGATMRMFPPEFTRFATSGGPQHLRDFLQYYIDSREVDESNKGKTLLNKIHPEQLPLMMVEWDRELRKAADLAETEGSLAPMHTAKNGWTISIIGSQKATHWVGQQLRNCLRSSITYFKNHTLLVTRNPEGKVITAIECDMYKRVSGVRLNCKTKPGFDGPFPVTAISLNQFYAAENKTPPVEAVDAFNEMCVDLDLRSVKDVNVHLQTDPTKWLGDDEEEYEDEDDEDEDEGGDEEEGEDEKGDDGEDEEDEAPRRVQGHPPMKRAPDDEEDESDF